VGEGSGRRPRGSVGGRIEKISTRAIYCSNGLSQHGGKQHSGLLGLKLDRIIGKRRVQFAPGLPVLKRGLVLVARRTDRLW
jgi:hypothetical protein